MPVRRPSTFKKNDVTRATLAVIATGLGVERVQVNIKEGSIVIIPGKPAETADKDGRNEWDDAA